MRRKKHIVTLAEAIDRIPHDEFYCNDSGRCPFWQLRKFSKNKQIKIVQKYHIFGIPTWYARTHELEYCSFLKEYLSIQDECKDCGINCDYPQSKYNDYLKYLEEKYKDKEPEFYKECIEDAKEYDIFTRRIQNREYADYLKEKFPDEAELIDKIVIEDKLEYWHNKQEGEQDEASDSGSDNN